MPMTFDALLNNLPENGIEKFIVRAKETLEDTLTDYYIVGSGHISDCVDSRNENSICIEIIRRAEENRELRSAIDEFSNEEAYIRENKDV